MISISPWLRTMFFHCKASSSRHFRSGLFSFNFWFLYKFRHVLKFVRFLFFKKCGIKDQIVPLKKART